MLSSRSMRHSPFSRSLRISVRASASKNACDSSDFPLHAERALYQCLRVYVGEHRHNARAGTAAALEIMVEPQLREVHGIIGQPLQRKKRRLQLLDDRLVFQREQSVDAPADHQPVPVLFEYITYRHLALKPERPSCQCLDMRIDPQQRARTRHELGRQPARLHRRHQEFQHAEFENLHDRSIITDSGCRMQDSRICNQEYRFYDAGH